MAGIKIAPDLDVSFIAVEQITPPSVIDDQIRRVALNSIAGTDYQEGPGQRWNQRKQKEQNTVLYKFRMFSKTRFGKRREAGATRLGHKFVLMREKNLSGLGIPAVLQKRVLVQKPRDLF